MMSMLDLWNNKQEEVNRPV